MFINTRWTDTVGQPIGRTKGIGPWDVASKNVKEKIEKKANKKKQITKTSLIKMVI